MEQAPIRTNTLIFTDLDGTLLDHNNYQFEPAQKALDEIKQRKIPLILNSSKTFAEMILIQQDLDICYPLICENGAAVCIPVPDDSDHSVQWRAHHFSQFREKILHTLKQLREEYHYQFTSFSDGDAENISQLTGLTLAQSELAAERNFSEPILWQDSEQALKHFLQQLSEKELSAQQGGRFLSIMGQTNKAAAMQWLIDYYQSDQAITTIALGDSPNDEAMLNNADIAVVIQSDRSKNITLNKPQIIIRTTESGPAGWQNAMEDILFHISDTDIKTITK